MNVKAVLFGLGLILSLAATGFIVAKVGSVPTPQGFTVNTKETFDPGDGRAPFITSTGIRHQKADGSWRHDKSYTSGKTDVGFKLASKGVFRVDEGNRKLEYLSAAGNPFNEARVRQDPGFVGEETILGFKTLVIRTESVETGEIFEVYICPALQGYSLKRVARFKSGAVNTFEVTKVEVGEPPEHVFTSLPKYDVDYETMKQKRPVAVGSNDQK